MYLQSALGHHQPQRFLYSKKSKRSGANLTTKHIGMNIKGNNRKLGAVHQACLMAKVIYIVKMELMLGGKQTIFKTAREWQGLQQFN